MSLTKVSYSMIAGAPVNVVDYGASTSATGVANSAAFLAAKAAAGTYTIAGQTIFRQVYIPPATYAIDGTVVGNFFTDGVVGITGGAVQYIVQQGVGASQSNTIFGPGAMPGATPTGGDLGLNNAAFGTEALVSNTTGYRNTGIGYAALRSTVTNYANTAIGASAGYSLSDPAATGNTVVGSRALFASVTGYFNTAIGSDSMTSTLGGYENTGCGKNTLYTNTSGYRNTAVGLNSLYSNTTGFNNTALGYQALFANLGADGNTAVGRNSCLALVSGGNNAAFGDQTLLANIIGGDNVAVGVQALNTATGSQNTAIGRGAGRNVTSGEGNVIVGSNSNIGYLPVFDITTENNRVVIGSSSVTNAYVQVAWTVVSDARDKTDFAPVPHGLDFVSKLQTTAYRYKINRSDTEGHGPVRYGFKAQDVLALEGNTPVIVDAEDPDKLRFNDQALIAVLVNAVKELKAEFDAYKAAQN